jgi:hypothetical protein
MGVPVVAAGDGVAMIVVGERPTMACAREDSGGTRVSSHGR